MGQLLQFQRRLQDFRDAGAEVFAVSVDSVYSHKAFAEKIGVEFPLLSDFNREVIHAYEVAYDEIFGLKDVAKRAMFVIGKDGIVKYKWVTDDARRLPDVYYALDAVRSLQE